MASLGFTGWHRRASACAVETTQNNNKTQLLARNYGTFQLLVVFENVIPQNGPSTQLLSSHRCDMLLSKKCETPQLELKSLRTFLAIKRCQGTKSKKL